MISAPRSAQADNTPQRGSQPVATPAPRFATKRNPANATFGPAVGKVAEAFGTPLMPWQQQVADTAFEVDDEGRFVYPTVLVTVPRQSGKTTLMLAACVHRALMIRGGRIWHTAQTGIEATSKFLELAELIELSPLDRIATIRRGAGSQSIKLTNGATVRPHPPKMDALHGAQSDLNFIDEAWSFDEVQGTALIQAIVPTQATRKGAQTIIVSTAGTADSVWWKELVRRGRAGEPGIAYFEWSIDDDTDPTDLDAVAAAHPAYGRTIDRVAFERASATMLPGEFARAFGNRWTQTREQVIPMDAFRRCQTEIRIPDDARPAFGAAVSIDRQSAAIFAAVMLDGVPLVEMVDFRDGTEWVGPRLEELSKGHLNAGIVVDAYGPAGTVVDYLTLHNVMMLPLQTRDVTAACADMYDRICTGRVLFRTSAALQDAVGQATKRKVGDAWAWSRQGLGSIAPLEAATFAVRAVAHAKAAPQAPRIYTS